MPCFDVRDGTCAVALTPKTLEVTTLGSYAEGENGYIEVYVIAKYVERLLVFENGDDS